MTHEAQCDCLNINNVQNGQWQVLRDLKLTKDVYKKVSGRMSLYHIAFSWEKKFFLFRRTTLLNVSGFWDFVWKVSRLWRLDCFPKCRTLWRTSYQKSDFRLEVFFSKTILEKHLKIFAASERILSGISTLPSAKIVLKGGSPGDGLYCTVKSSLWENLNGLMCSKSFWISV